MRIAELADRAGLPTSTVRYYERVGLLSEPERTPSGYRDYDEAAATRLLFITRARKMGISCDQINELLPIWGGNNCAGAHGRVGQLVEDKKAEIAERIAELERFADQLELVRSALDETAPPVACCTDLSCCVPDSGGVPVEIELTPISARTRR